MTKSIFSGTTKTAATGPKAAAGEDFLWRMTEALKALPPEPQTPFGTISIGRRSIAPPGAMRIIEDPHMTVTIEDWSDVRSPSRAVRRRRQGHKQRIRYTVEPKRKIYSVGDTLVMHPETAKEFRTALAERAESIRDDIMRRALFGVPSPKDHPHA